ncbi:MAG: type IX secretion system membrane protein PorP/SprF [Bacteroidales bacterium]|nr:type IX secretion system membrane protein PorP/SprF [Bacteroidales bacterium]
MIRTSVFCSLLVATMLSVSLYAQQEAQWAHNMFNGLATNPGYAGSINGICATGLARQQWAGFKENGENVAPETYQVSIHSPLNILHGGIGATIYQDKLAYNKEIGVKLAYAYRRDVGMGNLGIGLQAGFINGYIDYSKFNPRQSGDQLIEGKAEESDMLLDFGLGIHYFVPEKYSLGLSATRLSESESPGDILGYKTKRHYYLSGEYYFELPNPMFEINPSALVKSDGVKTEFSVAALIKYNNKFWGGVGYNMIRVYDPISVMIGFKMKDLRFGYSYGIPTSVIGSGGSHEIMVGYCFRIEFDRGRRSYKNTRFL